MRVGGLGHLRYVPHIRVLLQPTTVHVQSHDKCNHRLPAAPPTPSWGHRHGQRQHTVGAFAKESQNLRDDLKQGRHDCCICHCRSWGIRWRPKSRMLHCSLNFPGYFPKASEPGDSTSSMGRARVGNETGDLARNRARRRRGLMVLVHAGWVGETCMQTGRAVIETMVTRTA